MRQPNKVTRGKVKLSFPIIVGKEIWTHQPATVHLNNALGDLNDTNQGG